MAPFWNLFIEQPSYNYFSRVMLTKNLSKSFGKMSLGKRNEKLRWHISTICWLLENGFPGRIIIGSDRRPETKQGIEGKIDKFRSGRVRVRVRFRSAIWTYQFWRLL